MGPLLFLVMLVPFTLNGLAVREAFFVSFLGSLGVGADQAFAAGFLFFLVTVLQAVPGGIVGVWEGSGGGQGAGRAWLVRPAGRRHSSWSRPSSSLRRAALDREVPREPRRRRDGRRRQRLDGRHDRVVRDAFPGVRLVEAENRGLGPAGTRDRQTESRYVLLLNSDAWLVGDALSRLVAFADRRPEAAIIGPRLLNPDGSLQRSGARFSDPVAARDRVLLPAEARARSEALTASTGAASTTTKSARPSS